MQQQNSHTHHITSRHVTSHHITSQHIDHYIEPKSVSLELPPTLPLCQFYQQGHTEEEDPFLCPMAALQVFEDRMKFHENHGWHYKYLSWIDWILTPARLLSSTSYCHSFSQGRAPRKPPRPLVLPPRLVPQLGRDLRAGLNLLQFGAVSAVFSHSLTWTESQPALATNCRHLELDGLRDYPIPLF